MTLYTATSAVVAVPAGAPAGNRVIRFISRGGILPEDADQQTVDHLLELGMISVLPELEVADEPEATARAAVPPSSAARRCSTTSVVGFMRRV